MRALLPDLCYQVIDAADVASQAFIDHIMSSNGMAKQKASEEEDNNFFFSYLTIFIFMINTVLAHF